MRLACRIAAGPKRAPLRLVVPMIERNAGNAERGVGVAARDREKARRQREGRNGGHYRGAAKRKTAAATAQVQRPPGSPSAAAVMDVLPMMRLLV